jgi:hypothetical protein
MNDDTTFATLLRQLTHDGFTATSWVFTALTLFIVGLSLYRLVPRRPTNPIAPRRRDRER